MPAAPRAAAPPATNCLLVKRTSGLLRLDLHDAGHDPIDVLHDLAVREAELWHDVLAHGVERPVVLPRVENVPGVGTAVDRVDVDRLPCDLPRSALAAEARLTVAARHLSLAGIPAQVDVHLVGTTLEPQEADQVAPIWSHGVNGLPVPSDLPGQGVGKPARAIHGRIDLVGKFLPAGCESGRTGRGRRHGGRPLLSGLGRRGAATADDRNGDDDESEGSRKRPVDRAIHEFMMPEHRTHPDGYPRSP